MYNIVQEGVVVVHSPEIHGRVLLEDAQRQQWQHFDRLPRPLVAETFTTKNRVTKIQHSVAR